MFNHRIDDDIELRLLEERHADVAFSLVQRNRSHLRRWMPWLRENYSLEDTREYIRRNLKRLADNDGFDASIWYRGELAGQLGYNAIDWNNRATEIGYWLGAAYQGKGLIIRTCRVFVDYAFTELNLNRVMIMCAVENSRSRAVPERLGFTQEGVLRQAEWLHDHYADMVVYSMLAGEWPGVRP